MFVHALFSSPKRTSMELVDHHLESTIVRTSRIMGSALHRALSEKISVCYDVENSNPTYSYNGAAMFRPVWIKSKWVEWAGEHRNFWWLFTFLWFLNKERSVRFLLSKHHPAFEVVLNWQKAGMFQFLNGLVLAQENHTPFPIVKFLEPYQKNNPTLRPDELYLLHYQDVLDRIPKVRWTNRDKPVWRSEKNEISAL